MQAQSKGHTSVYSRLRLDLCWCIFQVKGHTTVKGRIGKGVMVAHSLGMDWCDGASWTLGNGEISDRCKSLSVHTFVLPSLGLSVARKKVYGDLTRIGSFV